MSKPLDPVEPSKWQVDNKDKAKEPFNRAAEGRDNAPQQQAGKVSETVRRDRPHMAPRPEGSLRTVETRHAYESVSKEQAQFKKEQAADRISKSLQKDSGLENNKDNSRADDRGR
jgi:hypothetical protein